MKELVSVSNYNLNASAGKYSILVKPSYLQEETYIFKN